MPGRNRLTGICWHEEWHTVDRKKEKAADCIFLDENRICRNRSCIINGEKCFVASHCKYRIKAEDAPKPTVKPKEWTCSLPKQCDVFSKKHGVGTYIRCDTKNHLITIMFDDGEKSYKYPDAFLQQQLYGAQSVTDAVLSDTQE